MAEQVTFNQGFVDMHVHFRDPGYTDAEDFKTGTEAALRDGVILSADMPNNPGDPTNSPEALHRKLAAIDAKARGDVALYVKHEPLGGEDSDIRAERYARFAPYKPVGGKAYTDFTTGSDQALGAEIFREDIALAVAEDPDWLTVGHVEGRSETNEFISMVAKDIGRVHIAHARRPELEAVIDFRNQHRELAYLVTTEVTPQHLFMHEGHIKNLGWLAMMKPLLTPREDAEWLRAHLHEVDAFATDHAPHPLMKKYRAQVGNPDMNVDPESGKPTCFGFASVEVARMVLLQLVHDGELSIEDYIAKVSAKPAEILRIEPREAQVVVDMTPRKLSPDDPVYTKCGTNPLAEAGLMAGGTVTDVIVEGRGVIADSQLRDGAEKGTYVRKGEKAGNQH